MYDPTLVASWIVGGFATIAAVFERVRNIKVASKREENAEAVSDAKRYQERGDLMSKLADEYKIKLEAEHKEHMAYRDWAHEKANKDQALLANSQDKIIELQARPDFTDLFEHLKNQSDTSVKILLGIGDILNSVRTLVEINVGHKHE